MLVVPSGLKEKVGSPGGGKESREALVGLKEEKKYQSSDQSRPKSSFDYEDILPKEEEKYQISAQSRPRSSFDYEDILPNGGKPDVFAKSAHASSLHNVKSGNGKR